MFLLIAFAFAFAAATLALSAIVITLNIDPELLAAGWTIGGESSRPGRGAGLALTFG
jgi:hypothetical protein